jgi:hypothetical protein
MSAPKEILENRSAYMREYRKAHRDALTRRARARYTQARQLAGIPSRSRRSYCDGDSVHEEKWSPAPGWIWDLLSLFWGLDVDQLQRCLVLAAPRAPKLGRPRGAGAKRKKGGSALLVTQHVR